jgi:hypothetical protein
MHLDNSAEMADSDPGENTKAVTVARTLRDIYPDLRSVFVGF